MNLDRFCGRDAAGAETAGMLPDATDGRGRALQIIMLGTMSCFLLTLAVSSL